ncbi:ferritin-like domain-containing protein [Parvibaculaceae bacterium PLY_AMNH_Bact1]|nr:ferritin-like domain-containing protein [Parvibaculaceae bacterium PLY_AMNH_Bact1]
MTSERGSLPFSTVGEAALSVLQTADADAKADLAQKVGIAWAEGTLTFAFVEAAPPDRPARPARPELRLPRDMPRRRAGGEKGRFALLHSLAHIELNAIDLAFDMVARFGPNQPREFTADWVQVGSEEGKHFNLLNDRLKALSGAYGDLPAHDGLWDAAFATRHEILARLAVVPMVLEARGLDVTPPMIEKLLRAGDKASADILGIIYEEEKGHVAAGSRWFASEIDAQELEAESTFHDLVRRYFKGDLKRPFNDAARAAAGLTTNLYEPLADRQKEA